MYWASNLCWVWCYEPSEAGKRKIQTDCCWSSLPPERDFDIELPGDTHLSSLTRPPCTWDAPIVSATQVGGLEWVLTLLSLCPSDYKGQSQETRSPAASHKLNEEAPYPLLTSYFSPLP